MVVTNPVQLIHPKRHGDARGWFTETYNRETFAALGIACTFVQDNHSLSAPAFTLGTGAKTAIVGELLSIEINPTDTHAADKAGSRAPCGA